MKKYIILVMSFLVAGLAIANVMLSQQCRQSNTLNEAEPDLRGVYVAPGTGACFVGTDADGAPMQAPLTLAIFFSAATECYDCLSEAETYKRLASVFCERGQKVVAVAMTEDSVAIDSFLSVKQLDIPLVMSRIGLTFEQMGMYPKFMPVKILYDSTLSMIYMDGANGTSESQANFEAAMLWLSEAVHEKAKTPDSDIRSLGVRR